MRAVHVLNCNAVCRGLNLGLPFSSLSGTTDLMVPPAVYAATVNVITDYIPQRYSSATVQQWLAVGTITKSLPLILKI